MPSPEALAIIDMLRSYPMANAPTLAAQRAAMDAMAALRPLPADVKCTPVDADGVPAEWIEAPGADPNRVVLYLHGGGYLGGSITSHRELTARIARASGARGFSLGYRLAPEHPFPAAVDDAVTGYRYLIAHGIAPRAIAIAGDSAGGGLTMAALLALKQAGDPLPGAGVCLSPCVDLEGSGASMTERDALDPMIHKDGLLDSARQYLNGADPRTPLASPLHGDLAGLPPLLIQVGTSETLYDDSTRLADKARAAGVDVTLEAWDGLFHVFQIFGDLPEATGAVEKIGAFIRQHTAAVPH